MNRAIILSCDTGQGHNSCAQALREYFEEKGVACEICDALGFVSKRFTGFVSWGHSFMYRHIPGLFKWGYAYSERHPGVLMKDSAAYRILTNGTTRMYEYIRDGGFDTVVCTHVFPAIMLTHVLWQHELSVRTAFLLTDYACCPGMESCDLDLYFLPCRCLRDKEHRCRLPRERVLSTGIPVRSAFWDGHEKEQAKRMLHIDPGNRHLLVMCGSMGCGPIVKIMEYITRDFPSGLEVTVICGTNEWLRRRLAFRYRNNGRVHIVGYADDISLYMDAADLYLTKPGGISVTEAAVKRLPMAFINAVAGCEQYNMDCFTNMGAAITAGSTRELAGRCLELLFSEGELRSMQDALQPFGRINGAERIYRALCQGEQECSRRQAG